ncbi:hypothetical protein PMAYCL1PPCAC_27441, partial [Pristionchus mayeri]
ANRRSYDRIELGDECERIGEFRHCGAIQGEFLGARSGVNNGGSCGIVDIYISRIEIVDGRISHQLCIRGDISRRGIPLIHHKSPSGWTNCFPFLSVDIFDGCRKQIDNLIPDWNLRTFQSHYQCRAIRAVGTLESSPVKIGQSMEGKIGFDKVNSNFSTMLQIYQKNGMNSRSILRSLHELPSLQSDNEWRPGRDVRDQCSPPC